MGAQMAESPYRGMSKEQLADKMLELGGGTAPGPTHLQGVLQVRCVSDLETALKSLEESQRKSAAASDNLANRVFWLNVVLTVATVVGTVIAFLTFLRAP
jgi:hypothetical protein